METEIIIRGNDTESKALRWLLKAVSKDSHRPAFNSIIITDKFAAGSDGFRIHAIQTLECLENHLIPGERLLLSSKIPAGNFDAVMNVDQLSTPPSFQSVIPEGESHFEIAINPAFLIQALQGMENGKPAYLRFYKDTVEREGVPTTSKPVEVSQPETNRYALIMPMFHRHDEHWRPFEPVEEEKEDEGT